MIDESKIKKIIDEREKLHPGDPSTNDYWNLLTKELTKDEDETIEFISNCNEHDIYWISEVFDDISEIFQSQRFIEAIKNIQVKYPNINFETDIMYAEMAIKNKSEYSYHVTLNLNARFQPMHRHDLEDALEKILSKHKLGYVDGGGTMQSASGEIEYCDIELMLKDASEESLTTLESIIEKLGVAKGSKLLLWNETDDDVCCERPVGNLEDMALYLNGSDLSIEIYQNCDINYVIEQTELLMKGIGSLYSWWEGPQNTALYFYGESYEKMFTAIKNFAEEYPLCQKCVINQIA